MSRAVINDPSISVYFQNFGKPDDHGLLAEIDGMIAGAVWTRILNGPVKGFGNLDNETPEFAISLLPEYRGRGLGTMLMKAMLKTLALRGYRRASLAVQKDNYAVSMYKKTGFQIIETTDQEYIMVIQLQQAANSNN